MADLDIQAARRSFGSFTALDDVDLEVADGELCVIVGPSGCGKSTLLRAVAGLEKLDAGTIHIGGEEVTRLAPKDRDIAFVFQSYALYPHLTVRRNLEFPLRMRGVDSTERERRVVEAAELLGIAELLERKPAELSGGQRQRVAMGRAMVRRPKLFLFDEPLSNLDAQLRGRMRVELVELHRQLGWTALYVTHDQAEAMTLGEKVVVMKGGRIRQIGPPRELYDRPVDVFVAGFVGNPPMNFFRGEVRDAGGERRFETPGWSVAAPQELKPGPTVLGVRPEDLEVVDSGLEARVRLVEDLGADRFVVAGAGETNVLYRAAESSPLPRTGDLVQLSLRSGKEHWFQDDRRVRREAS